ncbi:hypothetical protein CGRA01v4_12696 [Colletotrichum graminicola]|nr:hypothetical protein CGRA01v4_12696 [Colletotrichum graminicola]
MTYVLRISRDERFHRLNARPYSRPRNNGSAESGRENCLLRGPVAAPGLQRKHPSGTPGGSEEKPACTLRRFKELPRAYCGLVKTQRQDDVIYANVAGALSG